MSELTVSMQRYIKAVNELCSEGEGARLLDIASKVGVSKASACVAMKALQQKGMVYRDSTRRSFLTAKGKNSALLLLKKFDVLFGFLSEVLGVREDIAQADACAIEHIISMDALCALCRFTRKTARKNQLYENDCAALNNKWEFS